ERPQIIVANKMDLPEAEENLANFKEKVGEDMHIYPISAVTRQGLDQVLFAVADLLEVTPEFALVDHEDEDHTVVYKHDMNETEFIITRDEDRKSTRLNSSHV